MMEVADAIYKAGLGFIVVGSGGLVVSMFIRLIWAIINTGKPL